MAVINLLHVVAEGVSNGLMSPLSVVSDRPTSRSVWKALKPEKMKALFSSIAHHLRNFMRNAGTDGGVELFDCFGYQAAGFGGTELRRVKASSIINHVGSVKNAVSSNSHGGREPSCIRSSSYNEPKAALNARYEQRSPTVSL